MAEVKLKDVADKLGTSSVTVFNALSGKKGVSKKRREEIIKTAEAMGCDLTKYGRKKGTISTVGVIVPKRYIYVGTSFYWQMYQNIANVLSQNNLFTSLEITNDEPDAPLPQCASGETIDALIIVGRFRRAFLERIYESIDEKAHIPIILVDTVDKDYRFPAVLSANYEGMQMTTQYLIDAGHTEIGFVGTIAPSGNIAERFFGYRKALIQNGIEYRPEWTLSDREPDTEAIHIELPEKLPTAFACSSDYAAGVLYDKLTEVGIRVPEDVSLIGYDNYLYGHPLSGKLTTYEVDMLLMAHRVMEILQSRSKLQQNNVTYVESGIIERESVMRR